MPTLQFKTLKQVVIIAAQPEEVYRALMDSKTHSLLTGDTAKIDAKAGGKFSAYSGGIFGKFIELEKGKKIVMDWYCETDGWPEGHFSKLTFTFSKAKNGTKVVLDQKKIPSAAFKDISSGWKTFYWDPLKKMFK